VFIGVGSNLVSAYKSPSFVDAYGILQAVGSHPPLAGKNRQNLKSVNGRSQQESRVFALHLVVSQLESLHSLRLRPTVRQQRMDSSG